MSLSKIHAALDFLSSKDSTIEVYAIKYSHLVSGTRYTSFDLHFSDAKGLTELINDIVTYSKDNFTSSKVVVNPYDGFNPKNSIDKLSITDTIISADITKLIASITDSDDKTSIRDAKANAYAIKVIYKDEDGKAKDLYLITNKKPTYNYTNKLFFKMHTNSLTKMTDDIFQFQKAFDMLVYENTLYMPTKNFESMFNLEHTHRILCKQYVKELEDIKIISNTEAFNKIALSGQNPRKFTTFNKDRLAAIQTPKGKNILKAKFKLEYDSKNKCYIIEDEIQSNHLITILCNKAQKDLFDDDIIYEVSSSQKMDL